MLELISRRLREVTVRPTVGAGERCRWDALMGAHHYLPFRGLVGRSVRHVAVLGEHWLALVGWHAGAFKLKARDRWIGWLPEQQFRRLHLIANNARFLILRRGEPRFAGAGAEPSPALGRLPRNAWAPDPDRRNVHRSQPLHWGVLPGGELASAGANPRLCPQARHARDLGPPRQTEGGSGLPAGPRRARAALPPRRCPKVAKRRRPATVDRSSTAKPVGVSSWCARFPQHARAALSAGHHRDHRGRREACRIPWRDRDRRVLPRADPASASRPAGVLQPSPEALHRPVHDRVRQGSHPLGPRRARPRGAHLGRAAGLAHRPRRHRREVHPWRRPAQPGRQAPARRRCRAPLRNRPRTRGGTRTRATRSRPCVPCSPGSTSPGAS